MRSYAHRQSTLLGAFLTLTSLAAGAAIAVPKPPLEPAVSEPMTKNLYPMPAGASAGPLSPRFPEIQLVVSSSFAHDAGTVSQVKSLKVGGKPCAQDAVLQALVALRNGWTPSGGRTDAEIIRTVSAFADDWAALLADAGRLVAPKAPDGLASRLANDTLAYHPPKVAIYALDNGERIVIHAYFRTWDGGNHGRQYGYIVDAYQVSDGARFMVAPAPEIVPLRPVVRPKKAAEGPQPVDPKMPRPRYLREY